MKLVKVTVEFPLHPELEHMTREELIEEIRSLMEHEHAGVAEFGTAGVTAIEIKEE